MVIVFLVTVTSLAGLSRAQDVDREAVSPRRPLLDQLNRETRQLYDQVKQGVVRVQVPSPRWIDNVNVVSREQLLSKYRNLDPGVRRQIEQRDAKGLNAKAGPVGEALAERAGGNDDGPATAPGSPPTATDLPAAVTEGKGTYIVVPMPPARDDGAAADADRRDPVAGGKLEADPAPAAVDDSAFTPNNVGLVLAGGYVVVPLYVEREACESEPLRVAGRDGTVLDATFVGSDRQTNLTVIKTDESPGEPVRFAADKPDEGSLVMMIVPHDGSGRLGLWTGGAQEFAVVFTSAGEMAGVARYGQFLSGSACRLIASQIMRHGSVKRATLGVIISEIRADDPLRRQVPVLGAKTAMRIDQVMPGSAADQAGLLVGDLLLSLAGEPVGDIPTLAAAIAARSGNTDLQLLRGDEVIAVTVDLQPK